MPDRVIRAAVWDSERFLALEPVAKLCYLRLLSAADDLGNVEGAPGHLRRLWRDIGAAELEMVQRIKEFLLAADLVRAYNDAATGKDYLHVPRFRQRIRHVKRAHPRPPDDIEDKEIKRLYPKTPVDRQAHDSLASGARPSVVGSRAPAESNRIKNKNRAPADDRRSSAPAGAPPGTAPATSTPGFKNSTPNGNGHGAMRGVTERWTDARWIDSIAKLCGEPQALPGESLAAYAQRVKPALERMLKRPKGPAA